MSPTPPPASPPTFGSELSAVLWFCGAVVTGLLGWFGAQFTAHARLEKTLLDASRALVEQAQTQHARDGARILELEGEIVRMRGEVNGAIQREESLRRFIERAGLTPPPRLTTLKQDKPA